MAQYPEKTTWTGDRLSKVSMQLFGMPYQMTDIVDPRDGAINAAVGKNYLEKFLIEAPILTIIPGDPIFLPEYHGASDKSGAAVALLDAANAGGSKFKTIKDNLKNDTADLRLYDFKKSYLEYMRYVNLLCRVGAGYLDIGNYKVTFNGASNYLSNFDWKNYKWASAATNAQNFVEWVKGNFTNKNPKDETNRTLFDGSSDTEDSAGGMTFSEVFNNYHFVQFYIDPESTSGDDMSNSSTESTLKGLFDSVGSKTKELAWMMRNGQMTSDLMGVVDEGTSELSTVITEALSGGESATGSLASALSRVINLSGKVVLGENVVIPNIYNNSSYNKSGFSATIHLKAPYGNVLSYYLDVYVPMMHLVALTVPRQSTPNTYSSPFLVKSFVEGSWTCNLGLVSGLTISKNNEARSINGLPSEVDVTIQFEDLYSTLSMNPSNEPVNFAKNPSLVEYLATNCGMSLTKANMDKKVGAIWNSVLSSMTDAPANVSAAVSDAIFEKSIGSLRSLLGYG